MDTEQRIAALKTALAEKRATELCGGPNEQPNQLGIFMRNACVKDFREGASALAEIYRLEGEAKAYRLSGMDGAADECGQQLEALLAELEGETKSVRPTELRPGEVIVNRKKLAETMIPNASGELVRLGDCFFFRSLARALGLREAP